MAEENPAESQIETVGRSIYDTNDVLENPHLLSDIYNDKVKDMTFGRRFARYLTGKYSWYFPGKAKLSDDQVIQRDLSDTTEEAPPSLDSAWSYFEHFVLPRYNVKTEDLTSSQILSKSKSKLKLFTTNRFTRRNKRDELERSKPGSKNETRLYPVWGTSSVDLADFGMGVGLYFFLLKSLALIMLVAGCINITRMLYFSSEDYVDDAQRSIFKASLKGSAICTDATWEPCPTCTKSDWDDFYGSDRRYAESTSDSSLKFILRNHCKVDKNFGILSITTLCFILTATVLLNYILKYMEVDFDEAEQTASDYSIAVVNPPKDAYNLDEWKQFFENAAENVHVTLCSVVLDNEELVNALVKRRQLLLQIQNRLPFGVKFDPDNLDEIIEHCVEPSWFQKRVLCAKSPSAIHEMIKKLQVEISDYSERKYDVSSVYITFETEKAQRTVLKKMTTSGYAAQKQKIPKNFPQECLFRGTHLLRLREPDEPDSIRWDNLDETDMTRFRQRATTFIISLVLLAGSSSLIYAARLRSATVSSFTITIMNVITPIVVKKLQTMESHRNQSSYEASQFIKITLFRWVNTAIVTKVFTPFTETLANGSFLIDSILSIFISEMTVTPILALLDYMSNIKKHILGPRAVDQRRMNLNFTGGYYNIGERYTAATKVLFFTLFYCTLFPQGFFFATAILTITYWTDKHALLRTWCASPKIGSEICTFTRKYFIPLAVMTYAIIGSYDYTAFPFDNACETSQSPSGNYIGSHNLKVLNGDLIQISVPTNAKSFKFCNQDMKTYSGVAFPAVPVNQPENGKWMGQEQEDFSSVYGWVGFGAFCVIAFNIFFAFLGQYFPYFYSHYKPRGEMTDYEFSKQESIQGYIPQIHIPGYAFPVVLCDVDSVRNFVGWQKSDDPNYDNSNIVFDVEKVSKKIDAKRSVSDDNLEKSTEADETVFSSAKFWEPTSVEE